jgi:nitrogen fixation protein NifU and related proteins
MPLRARYTVQRRCLRMSAAAEGGSPAGVGDIGVAALYQEIILSHYRAPKRKGVLPSAPDGIEHSNPLCGDVLSVQLACDGDRIVDAGFTARACSITQATASLLLDRLVGLSIADAAMLVRQVEGLVEGTLNPDHATARALGDLLALSSVARFPARRACVRLVTAGVTEALLHR